jgi:hypothetical protein
MKRRYFRLPTCATMRTFSLAAPRVVGIVAAAALFWLPNLARATSPGVLTVGSDIEFSNGEAPASATKPWVVMTIADNGGGAGPFVTAAHIQNTTGAGHGGGGGVADTTGGTFHGSVPEPSSIALAALGCFSGLWLVRPWTRHALGRRQPPGAGRMR